MFMAKQPPSSSILDHTASDRGGRSFAPRPSALILLISGTVDENIIADAHARNDTRKVGLFPKVLSSVQLVRSVAHLQQAPPSVSIGTNTHCDLARGWHC
jgi:hypothetical protein